MMNALFAAALVVLAGPQLAGKRGPTKASCASSALTCTFPNRTQPADSRSSCNPGSRTVVVTIGDSILAGNYTDIAAQLQTELGANYVVQGCASGGFLVADCTTQFNTYAHVGVGVVVWNCAINNILNGYTGAQTWALARAQLEAIRAQGVRVVVASIGPCGGYATCNNTYNDEYNTSLSAWCSTQGSGCTFVDENSLLEDPNNNAVMRAECITGGDQLHPSALCSGEYVTALAEGVTSP